MHELVKLAEVRETRAKEEMARLLEARAEVYHSATPPPQAAEDAPEALQTGMLPCFR